jgi:hypothetical protein
LELELELELDTDATVEEDEITFEAELIGAVLKDMTEAGLTLDVDPSLRPAGDFE